MNSDLMPSPESSNSTASSEAQASKEVVATSSDAAAKPSQQQENLPDTSSETANDGNFANRQHPIPPPSEPMQYRAIGLVRGRYIASSEQFTQGVMLTADGTKLDAVLLGRIMSLVKNHLDLEQEHLWVVYPRTRQENDNLHLQIVGVWEPENLSKTATEESQDSVSSEQITPDRSLSEEESQETTDTATPSTEIPDGNFSVRGEIVFQSYDAGNLVVKIKQSPRKPNDKPKYFKLKLKGNLDARAVGKFWDLQVTRDGECLVIEKGEAIAELPKKRTFGRKPPFRGRGGGRPGGGGRKPYPPRRPGEAPPRPTKKVGDSSSSSSSRPTPKSSAPKPVKRPKPPEQ